MHIEIRSFTAQDIDTHQASLVELLHDVVDGGASVNFIAPLDAEVATQYWQKVAAELIANERIMLAALHADEVVGSVQLALAKQPNGQHRAEVQKVFTHSKARRQGIARRLMEAVEDEARKANRTLLVLDTERDSAAEKLYQGSGYERVGVIPQFALNHDGSQLIDTVLYYKLLK